jgi:hypothetical protein
MTIKGAEGLTNEQILQEIQNGAKFVTFPYCISVIIISFRRSSDVHFIRSGENAVVKSLPWLFISFFLGWWGFPWGIIWTPVYIFNNLSGGKNVTDQFLPALQAQVYQQAQPVQTVQPAPDNAPPSAWYQSPNSGN